MEHFITLFDHRFLPQGLVLHETLQRHAAPCELAVVCLDEKAEKHLRQLALPHLKVIPLAEFEDTELLRAKANRTWTEYCWTLTPSVCLRFLEQNPACPRVTYVDADLSFFQSPAGIFSEFEKSGKKILITEHAYAPRYAHLTQLAGRFCVQYLTFANAPAVHAILKIWRDQCLTLCTAVATPGAPGFGDQKYLEDWPERFGEHVHILQQPAEALAPWNVDHYQEQAGHPYFPTFFHFHGLRIHSPRCVRLSSTYAIRRGDHLYQAYLDLLDDRVKRMCAAGIPLPTIPLTGERFWAFRTVKRFLFQHLRIRQHLFPTAP